MRAWTVTINLPDRCPLYVDRGQVPTVRYAATIFGDPTYIARLGEPGQSVLVVRVYNADTPPILVNTSGSPAYFYFAGSPPRTDAYVDYYAASEPISLYNDLSADGGYIDVVLRNGAVGRALTALTYTYGVRVVVSGPANVTPGSSFTVGADFSNYTAPLAVQWYRNGQHIASGGSNLVQSISAAGSYSFRVEVTDVQGDRGVASQTVSVGTASGGGGGGSNPCGGGEQPSPLRAPTGDSAASPTRDGSRMMACPP